MTDREDGTKNGGEAGGSDNQTRAILTADQGPGSTQWIV
jgi:hypothetical protein